MSTIIWPSDREPYHGDIVQGNLGNCFLIASLQALASCQPQLLKSIISLSPLACHFYRQGLRVEIPVEVEPLTEENQYCRSTINNVQWPYIIERAYAKFYGGRYENLIGGNTSEAFYDLLGKPVEEHEPNDRNLWEKIEKGLAQKTSLITCGYINTNNTGANNAANGFIVNHAYSILATFIYQQTREKYVLIHNPHGTNQIVKENNRARNAFFNSISKAHPLWSNTPGTQLLSWTELTRTCNRIQICSLNVESRQLLTGEWSAITNGGCSNFSTFYKNPYFIFPASYAKNSVIILGHTSDQRHARAETDTKLNYEQLGITIIQLKSHQIPTQDNYDTICQSKFWNKREVALTIDFEPKQGKQHAAVLSTYYPNVSGSFWIQIFSKQSLPTIELRSWNRVFREDIQTIRGEWNRDNAGGRKDKSAPLTFYKNPAYCLTLSNASVVRCILHQLFDDWVPLAQHHPLGIYVLPAANNEEPAFVRARSVSMLVHLDANKEYHIVPTCFEANSLGKFELDILCDVPFTVDPVARKLPTPPPPSEEETTARTSAGKAIASASSTMTKRSITKTTTTKATVTGTSPTRRNPSLGAARMSSLTTDYAQLE